MNTAVIVDTLFPSLGMQLFISHSVTVCFLGGGPPMVDFSKKEQYPHNGHFY